MKQNSKKKIISNLAPFILGVATSFSLPPYNFLIINFIIFPFLILLIIENIQESKFTVFKIGWFYGFGYFLSSLYWITNALTFEEIFKPLIPIALIVIPLFLGLFYGFGILIFSFFKLEKNLFTILLFSLIFSVIEFVRGFILGGFPWNLIVYSWTKYTDFLQILTFIGTYSFNLISITLFLVPSVIFFNNSLRSKIIIIIFSIIFVGTNFYYGKHVKNNYNKLESISLDTTIKIISPRIEIDRFFQNEDPYKIINELIKLSKPSSEDTIFVFPEGILTSIFLEDIHIYKNFFKDSFLENHKILLGINSNENSKIYNSMVVLDNNLNVLSKYNKNKLVPFGEFVPFENMLSKFGLKKITQGYQSFSSDKVRQIININNLSFVPLICYEIIYSGLINKQNEDFDFLLNISEDGWFGETIGPHQHFAHSIFRSIEEGKNLVRSANNGTSAFINPKGQLVDKIKSTNSGFIEIKAFRSAKKTFFSTYGNMIFFYFIFFYISLIFFIKKIGR